LRIAQRYALWGKK